MQIQISEEQARILNQLAADRGISVAELIHIIIERYIHSTSQAPADQRSEKALAIIGAFSSKHADLSTDHDRYLVKIYDGDTKLS